MPGSFFHSKLLATSTTRCDDALPPPPPPGEAPPPPPPKDSIAEAAASTTLYSNPGPYEMAAMDGKRLVQLDTFDGFRCDINKQLSPYMAVVHSFLLGTTSLPDRTSTYSFVTQVADEQGILMTRVDPGRGSVDGRVHRAVLGGLAMAKLQLGLSPDGQQDQALAELDFGGLTWTGNLKYGSMAGAIVYGCNYLQSITPQLQMGGEGMYIAANQSLISNYTLKYTIPASTGDETSALPGVAKGPERKGSSMMCVNYNTAQNALSLNYKRVVTPNRVTLGAELQCSPLTLESQVLLGAEFKLHRSRFAICVDGGLRTQSILEAKLGVAPGSPTLNFSADVDHLNDAMRFGYGITIEG
ncbi:mitochondrial import receptor subunit TOM40 [Fistulifera solaris]|uniref:Mitochondrial import receptor subunit TOM40 n=1 Tax=Fistulifera solaris TaxID=1519565 RepID=A0A1Z5KJ88_FISSO|nr:mitochondrial import receptor subunit TOM40 [Fistulifera solaris]|eukprot:GAX26344.1 mitochondrial import receptor subunit TOM40 [Fistulifera solaris]